MRRTRVPEGVGDGFALEAVAVLDGVDDDFAGGEGDVVLIGVIEAEGAGELADEGFGGVDGVDV